MTHFDNPLLIPLKNWLKVSCALKQAKLQPLINDASWRQYFRLQTDSTSYVVMIAPPEKENLLAFIAIAKNFARQGIYTPEILAYDLKQGFMLLSDLGNGLYLNLLNRDTADDLYTRALSVIEQIQMCKPKLANDESLASFNEQAIYFELGLFTDWFLNRHLQLTIGAKLNNVLDQMFKRLVSSALEQPQVCMHRDYHSRNLLLMENNKVGVLDFQDAVYGPITYDAASLLRDAYIEWPEEQANQWILKFYDVLIKKYQFSLKEFLRWFDFIAIQRHLKILGIFARLRYRDNKPHYLSLASRLLNYISKTCEKYPELTLFNQSLLPHIQTKLTEKEKI